MNKGDRRLMHRIDHAVSRRIRAAGRVLAGAALVLAAGSAAAEVPGESKFVLNTFSFLIWGVLVMWMCAGFTMLEAGSVRTKNASVICLKNIGLYSIAGLAYYFLGYNLMYVDVSGWIGSFQFLYGPSPEELALLDGDEEAKAAVVESGYSKMSDWFFQMVFVATAASIVSGTLAERVKLWSFFAFITVLTAVIYPTIGAWTWGGGWLSEMGFQDFAGSTIVHSTGGWAALAGAIVVGARQGQVPGGRHRQVHPSLECPGRDARRVHPVARVVRLQRRLAACAGRRGRRGRHEQRARQHQPRGGGRGHGRDLDGAADSGTGRPCWPD